MAGYFNGAVYARIDDSPNLDLTASPGWAFTFFVYPDTSISEPDFGYIYSHGQPLAFDPAINIIRGGYGAQTLNTIRVILDWAGGNLVDVTTTDTLTSDAWNRVMVSYEGGGNLLIGINGSVTSYTPPSLPNILPAGEARIGYSVAGGTRNFPGRIAHAAKYDRVFSLADITAFSATLLSPSFAQNSQVWHSEMFTGSVWDIKGNVNITPQGMSWADHGPFIYPAHSDLSSGVGFTPSVAGDSTYRYFRMA